MRGEEHGDVATGCPAVIGVVVLVVCLAAAGVSGVVFRRRNGTVRSGPADVEPLTASTLAALVPEPGERATLLQFSSAFCAPCRATHRILSGVADVVPGVRHIEVDAESHLDAVRALEIRRTPTTLILGPDRRVLARASGQPRRDEVLATLAGAVA